MIVAAVEGGGTKFVCGLVSLDGQPDSKPEILDSISIATELPEKTLKAAVDFFLAAPDGQEPRALGIGCFGPLDPNPESPAWGSIGSTPKPGWSGFKVGAYFRKALGLPMAFDTDVNAAALAERLWGAARGLKDFVYLTVGTGIGGGVFARGGLVHGLAHPELGHIKLPREPGDDFQGCCPFHRDCLEGMASGPAMALRWKAAPESLPPEHEAWELEARYLAKAIATYSLVLSPRRILLGGGVGLRPGLAERAAFFAGEELAGYVAALRKPQALAAFLTRAELGAWAGLLGAAGLAYRASGTGSPCGA